MSLPKMTTPINNISLLDDLPNAVGGLSAAELKARFDKAGGDIQTFLNDTLIPALEQMGVDEGTARDAAIQAAIDALELDTTVENLQKAIAAAESRAKEYADNKDASNLTAAKQYADGKAAAAANAAVNAAAADATSKANTALSDAKSYTDDKAEAVLAEAERVSGSDAQNAESAAKQYADTQDAATLTAAKEYTDGKIPAKLPNPQKLKFTGAVTGEYDGSEEKTINIPTGGGAALPEVLGNLGTAMTDAAEGAIPVADGANGWAVEKLIKAYTGAEDLIGYIPATEWVVAYLSKNTVRRVDGWAGENGIASLAANMPIGICNGTTGTPPAGMIFPALLIFGAQSYGRVSYTCLDAIGAVWYGDISLSGYTVTATKKAEPLPTSTAADAGKLLRVGADGAAAWDSKLPTALKNPNALTFTGAATGTYDGSEAMTVNIPSGGSSGGSGGALKAMSAVGGYIGIPAAELPENGVVWMCFGSGDQTELYTGTVTIQNAGIGTNDMLVITNGTVNQLNQVAWVSDGLAVYGHSASDYRGVYQVVGGGRGSETWELVAEIKTTENVNSIRATFDACSAVVVEFLWGGVENDLGDIGIFPNVEGTPYTSEKRTAAANVTSSTTQKVGVLCVRIDCRVGSHWYATSWQKGRGDGQFGAIDAGQNNNLDVGLNGSAQYSLISSFYMNPRNDPPASGVKSITAYGAGMAIGTTLKVWGIKK